MQAEVHRELTRAGLGEIVGYKIGCTTRVMQEYLGIGSPCAGGIFSGSVHASPADVDGSRLVRPGVECELAVVLGADLDAPEDAAAAVAACMAAIEIVDDRYEDYGSLAVATLIADDFFGAGCVLGERVDGFDPRALVDVTAQMSVNGEPVGAGTGSDVLGDPLNALAWLAAKRIEQGAPLRAGEFVLLGSVVQTCWIEAGDEVLVENDPLGTVRLRLR